MATGRSTLFAAVGILVLGAGLLTYHYRGRIRNILFGHARAGGFKADDLYNADNHLFKRGRRDKPEVCLTIDDGPHPSLHRILPILQKFGAHATFFMVGSRISASPVLVRQVLAEGNEIGNHTENHERLNTLPPDRIRAEITECEAAFEKATNGKKMTLFRPPGMDTSPDVYKILLELGYTTVGYNYGAKDFIIKTGGPNVTIGEGHIADHVLDHVTPGGIILLHDSDDTADALPTILEGLKKRGLAVKTVTEMLAELPKPVFVATNAGP